MNRTSTKAQAANQSGPLMHVRQLLHAFADAGQPLATGLQLLVVPNGGLIWTEDAPIDRSEPHTEVVVISAPAARIQVRPPAAVQPQESAGSPVFTPLEPVGN
jgi:hypothetical protein